MSGNGEVETPSEEGSGEEGNGSTEQPKTTSGKVLRDKLEATLVKNQELEAKLLVHEAGLSHLTEKQRNAVVRDAQEGGSEITADILKASAKDLGFPESAASAPKKEGDGGEGGANEGQGGNEPDPAVGEALNSMDAIERASRAATPALDPNSFEAKVNAAKSAAEVEALIRTEGHKVGIVHELDVE